ncbi:MAG TPA: acyl carrier protein [Alphaproteobacteria bacterium]|nr:acyl carrier protein [Alphaproteobacteria bacterium]
MAHKADEIAAQIIGALAAIAPASAPLSGNTKIARDLGLDSVAIMDFIMELEERFDILIPLDQIANVETIQDLSVTIEALMKDAA